MLPLGEIAWIFNEISPLLLLKVFLLKGKNVNCTADIGQQQTQGHSSARVEVQMSSGKWQLHVTFPEFLFMGKILGNELQLLRK